MILLNEITIKNFLSHEDTTIHFNENEKLLVDGKSGSGKSSITEAILWVLYGKGRTDNRSLVRKGTKSASVSLKLDDGPVSTIITRTVSSAGKNVLTVTQRKGKDKYLPIERTGLKDMQDFIEREYLKASYELFTNSVAYPQENENSFVKATASKRKDLLLEIVRAGNFDELYEKARKALNANETGVSNEMVRITFLENSIKNSEIIASKYDSHKEAYDMTTKQVEEEEKIEKSLEGQLNNVSQISKMITSETNTKNLLEKTLNSSNTQLQLCQKTIKDHETFDISIHYKNVEEIGVFSKEADKIEQILFENSKAQQHINEHMSNRPSVFDYKKDIEDINKSLISLMKEMGKCPAGDNCPFLVPVKGQIDFLSGQLVEKADKSVAEQEAFEKWEARGKTLTPITDTTDLYNKLKDIRSKIEVLSKSKDVITQYELVKNSIGDYKTKEISLNIEIDQTRMEIIKIEKGIRELNEDLVKYDSNKINTELSTIRVLKRKAQIEVENSASGMAMATNAQKDIKEASTALKTALAGVSKANEDKESLELIKEAFSPRGVKAVIIDYLVPQLEERINGILKQMSDFRIRLDTQKALVDDEGVKEGLFITVINDHGEELPFQSYSGGEKVKITVAISEALASLMSQVGFRIMDENIVSLDRDSTEGFVKVLTNLQEKFPQLLVISHLQEVKDIFEKKITIIKANGISKIYE